MFQGKLVFGTCLVIALAGAPASAQSVTPSAGSTDLSSADAARVIHNVNASDVVSLADTHASFLGKAKMRQALDAAAPMSHLQLVLKRSATRQAASEQLSKDQHNPSSPQFRHWLTPQEYGAAFGVADNDIAAISSWLTAEGFRVNAVYPNRMQIDFSGNAGQVDHAFGVTETRYTFASGATVVTNDTDISVPSALRDVIAGVSGLSRFLPSRKVDGRELIEHAPARTKAHPQAITDQTGDRKLVPNDLVTMYGVRTLRDNNVVGAGTTVALVELGGADEPTWSSFSDLFNLSRYGGTLTSEQPQGPSACGLNPLYGQGSLVSTVNAEWVTAMSPGANIVVASCADSTDGDDFSGIYAAATNLVNTAPLPNIIDVDYSMSEALASQGDLLALDLLWEQADVEGISVFVPTGDTGPSQMNVMYGSPGRDVNALATSAHVTAVGGSDLADKLDGTTSQYFAAVPSAVGGTALSYVPEIPWNDSCGNGVVAKHLGYNRVIGYCNDWLRGAAPIALTSASVASGGGSSIRVAKPTWQNLVYNAAPDQSRDIPDVVLFGGSYDGLTKLFICTDPQNCTLQTLWPGDYGTSLSTVLFAGIQAVMDQGLASRGYPRSQGNAAPTLYALAATEYGKPSQPQPSTLAACDAANGANGTANCIFHNITRGAISDRCIEFTGGDATPNCFFYATVNAGSESWKEGLTTVDENPTSYSVDNKAYGAQQGWSFASGLGSVNATNLLIAWRAFAKTK